MVEISFSSSESQDVSDVVSSWLSTKKPIPSQWNESTAPINSKSSAELQAISQSDCLDLVYRTRKTTGRLKFLAETLTELAEAMRTEYDVAQRNNEAVEKMYGLVALPEELMLRIFEHVVHHELHTGETDRRGYKAALAISHVSRLFRDMTLSCPQLWTDIDSSSAFSVECLTRSKDAPLNVTVHVGFHPDDNNIRLGRYLPDAMLRKDFWKKLILRFYHEGKEDRANTMDTLKQLTLPFLDTIVLNDEAVRNPGIFVNWKVPRLRCAVIINRLCRYVSLDHVPRYSSISILANITRLEISLEIYPPNVPAILEDLSRMSVLEELKITLNENSVYGGKPVEFFQIQLPNIRRLELELNCTGQDEDINAGYLFSYVTFPRAVQLDVKINGISWRTREGHLTRHYFLYEMKTIFIHADQFPLVETLKFIIDVGDSVIPGCQRCGILIEFPLRLFPSAKILDIRSNATVYYGDDEEARTRVSTKDWVKLPAEHLRTPADLDVVFYPTLETIILDLHDISRCFLDWLYEVFRRQKNQGEERWNAFKELIFIVRYPDGEEWIGRLTGEEALAQFEPREDTQEEAKD